MILPSKHLSQDRALLTVGSRILQNLNQPKTVSALWEELSNQGKKSPNSTPYLKYDQFILGLDLLFLIGAIELTEGIIKRKAS